MIPSSSVVPQPPRATGATSHAEGLFQSVGLSVRLYPTATSKVSCDYCERVAFEIIGNCISVVLRHNSQWHRTVIPLEQLGLARID